MKPKRYEKLTEEEWNSMKYGIIYADDLSYSTEPTVYVDMDGTLAVWHNMSRKFPDEAMTLDEIEETGYFRSLEPIPEMIDKVKMLKDMGYNVKILSKAYYHAIEEKTEWIKQYMPFMDIDKDVFFCPLNANKNNFVPPIMFNDILIDDYNVNLNKWKGIPLKIVTDKNTARYDIVSFNFNATNEEFLQKIDEAVQINIEKHEEDLLFYGDADAIDTWIEDESIRTELEKAIVKAIEEYNEKTTEYGYPYYSSQVLGELIVADEICSIFDEAIENEEERVQGFDWINVSLTKNYDLHIFAEMDSSVGFYSYVDYGYKLSEGTKNFLMRNDRLNKEKHDKIADKYFEEMQSLWSNDEIKGNEIYEENDKYGEMKVFEKPVNRHKTNDGKGIE